MPSLFISSTKSPLQEAVKSQAVIVHALGLFTPLSTFILLLRLQSLPQKCKISLHFFQS